jgi:restriction endonuclease Mrr
VRVDPVLLDLLIEHGVGVTEVTPYTLKRIDSDHLDEDAD